MNTAPILLLLSLLLPIAGWATPGRAPAAAAPASIRTTATTSAAGDGGYQAPVPVLQTAPVYPRSLYGSGESGTVEVGFIVDWQGNVRDAHIIQASNEVFAGPALAAVVSWKFRPGMVHGRPVNTRMVVPISFTAPREPPHPLTPDGPYHPTSAPATGL